MSELPVVRLRALSLGDADLIEAADTQLADPFNWAGFRSPGSLHARIADRTVITPSNGQLAVVDAGEELVGNVDYRSVRTGASDSSFCWAIGVSLLPEHRGRGFGAAAQRELGRYLFTTTSAVRVEADTEVDNVAEQHSLERAGFTREGVRRQSMFHNGQWRDTVVYAALRGEL